MSEPTGGAPSAQPPDLLHYKTWADEEGYHARLFQELPRDALEYGCVQEIWATTETEMIQKAAHIRVKVWTWESSGLMEGESAELPFRTGDPS